MSASSDDNPPTVTVKGSGPERYRVIENILTVFDLWTRVRRIVIVSGDDPAVNGLYIFSGELGQEKLALHLDSLDMGDGGSESQLVVRLLDRSFGVERDIGNEIANMLLRQPGTATLVHDGGCWKIEHEPGDANTQ